MLKFSFLPGPVASDSRAKALDALFEVFAREPGPLASPTGLSLCLVQADGETAGGGEDDLDRGSSGEGVEDASQGAALKDGVERRSRNVRDGQGGESTTDTWLLSARDTANADPSSQLAFLTKKMGRPIAGMRTALPKPRTEFKVRFSSLCKLARRETRTSKLRRREFRVRLVQVTLWSVLKDCIGRDLSRISIPVFFNEPTSFLQRQCEDLQYCDLLRVVSLRARDTHRV